MIKFRSDITDMPEMLTQYEVCNVLNISRTTLWIWRRDKNFPCHDFGKTIRFNRHEVEQWMKENAVREYRRKRKKTKHRKKKKQK